MPTLSSPILPLKVPLSDLDETIRHIAYTKNWRDSDISIKSKILLLTPIYYFSYEAFREQDKEGHITDSFKGNAILDAHNSRLEMNKIATLKGASDEIPKGIDFKMLDESIDSSHIEKIISLKLSKELKVRKENIIISGLQRAYSAKLVATILINSSDYIITIDGCTGEISEKIPYREKSIAELTREMLNELKEPRAWITYLKGLISGIQRPYVYQGTKMNILYVELFILVMVLIALIWVALLP